MHRLPCRSPGGNTLDITQNEARAALDQIKDTRERTRKMAAYSGADVIFIIWGIIWILGYTATQFIPAILGYKPVVGAIIGTVWFVLVVSGIAATYLVSYRKSAVKSASDSRLGWLWWIFYMYIWIWFGLLSPFISITGNEQSQQFWRHMGALSATIPMFMYTVMGLFLDMYLLWLGLLVTALTIAGLFLLPSYFYLWMAAAGGGTLIATGLLVRNRWK